MPKNLYLINKYLIEKFIVSLKRAGFSKVTIKNYITDINQFLIWRDSQEMYSSDNELIVMYLEGLKRKFSPSSIKRKSSAIRKYLIFENKEISSTPKSKITISQIKFVPIAIGLLLVVAAPLLNHEVYSNLENISEEVIEIEKDIPVNTIISTSTTGQVYSFDSSRGIKVVLANDAPNPPSLYDGESYPTTVETFANELSLSMQGEGIIYRGKTETIIVSDVINASSFITLTAKSSTGNQTLYVDTHKDGYVVVKVDNPALSDITFQWKIDNTEVYHSIL